MLVIKRTFVALIVFIFLTGCSIEIKSTRYKYVDYDNNEGYADYCFHPYGNFICELADGTRVQVKSYKEVNGE